MTTSRRPTVLLVDDNEDNRLIYRAVLRYHGLRVITVPDGESAVRVARRLRPDLVLMDIDLPGIDGWHATRTLRMHPDTRDTRVIALTARDSEEDQRRALEVGCRAYLVKPCSPLLVASEVTRVLREPDGRDISTERLSGAA